VSVGYRPRGQRDAPIRGGGRPWPTRTFGSVENIPFPNAHARTQNGSVTEGTSITLHRGKGTPFDLGAPFEVLIDGNIVGLLRTQESKTFDLVPGLHLLGVSYFVLRRSNDLIVRLAPAETGEFNCRTRWYGSPLISPSGPST